MADLLAIGKDQQQMNVAKSPISDEFFDAEEDYVETVKDDDNEFMEKLTRAIDDSPPLKKLCTSDLRRSSDENSQTLPDSTEHKKPIDDERVLILNDMTNGDETENAPRINPEKEELQNDESSKPIIVHLENDLLKDVDNEINDFDSIEKQVDTLLAIAEDDTDEQSSEKIETKQEKTFKELPNTESGEVTKESDSSASSPEDSESKDEELLIACESPVQQSGDDEIKPQSETPESTSSSSEEDQGDEVEDAEKDRKQQKDSVEPKLDDMQLPDDSEYEQFSTVEVSNEPGTKDVIPGTENIVSDDQSMDVIESTIEVSAEKVQTSEEIIPETSEQNNKEEYSIVAADTEEKTEEDESSQVLNGICENDDDFEASDTSRKTTLEKLNFLRKFSSAFGAIPRRELEELLMQKIAEVIIFHSENSELRTQIEKQERAIESFQRRLNHVSKQYQDLEMIHGRVIKDLKERPEAAITPVKITRAVGLQVYQPGRAKSVATEATSMNPKVYGKRSFDNKSPITENDSSSEINAKRKKGYKITPMRPSLSDKERQKLELQEAKEKKNVVKNVICAQSPEKSVIMPASVTMTPVTTSSNGKISPSGSATNSIQQSIDLTDDDLDDVSSTSLMKVAAVSVPALVPFRAPVSANSAKTRSIQAVNPFILKSPTANNAITSTAGSVARAAQCRAVTDSSRSLINSRGHPASLPITPAQITMGIAKRIPPKPTIKINNVHNGIIVSWTVDSLTSEHAEIHSYQIFAYEATNAAPATENWRHVGDVKALLLPMAVTLTQFQEGQKYFFAVRAVDIHKRLGQFSAPKTWIDKPTK